VIPDPFEMWDAAYVLGSLSSSERREYEMHLRDCARCGGSVAELSGMPALLALVDRDAVGDSPAASEPPPLRPQVFDDLLDRVTARRRRSRGIAWAVAAALLAVLVSMAGIGVVKTWDRPANPVVTTSSAIALPMVPVAPTSLAATLTLTPREWGTDIDMTCIYREEESESPGDADDADRVAMVAVGRDGSHVQLATWMARAGVTALPSASTSLPIDQIASVQVVSADTGDVLLEKAL